MVSPAEVDRELDSILPKLEKYAKEERYHVVITTQPTEQPVDHALVEAVRRVFEPACVRYTMEDWQLVHCKIGVAIAYAFARKDDH